MNVAVVLPWRAGCPHRERALTHVTGRYTAIHPDWELIVQDAPPGLFSRAACIIDGAARTDADVIVAADSDVWCTGIAAAVDAVGEHGWAVPHLMVHRLSAESTDMVIDEGAAWEGLALSSENRRDSRPYKGYLGGGITVIRRDVLERVPPDRRMAGWGSEDEAWALALRTLVGPPWRGDADLVHLWHPPQPRLSRSVGTRENRALLNRYHRARNKPAAMRALVEEGRTWTSTASST